ncbi:PaaI family thioesterase [Salipiger sp.]|uniref:PaaI family thioesterase n=1 Tax=Salipiger sp. TaxID=2078585 RepID=UPI003A97E66D
MDGSVTDRHAALIAADRADPPEGFVEIPPVGNFDTMLGALYGRPDGDRMVMGFRVCERHINAHGTCHGGMLASFADMLAYAARVGAGLMETSMPTVTLSVDYLRPVMLGDWVEGRSDVTKNGKRLLFSRITAEVDGVTVMTATSINVPGSHDATGGERLRRVMGSGT